MKLKQLTAIVLTGLFTVSAAQASDIINATNQYPVITQKPAKKLRVKNWDTITTVQDMDCIIAGQLATFDLKEVNKAIKTGVIDADRTYSETRGAQPVIWLPMLEKIVEDGQRGTLAKRGLRIGKCSLYNPR